MNRRYSKTVGIGPILRFVPRWTKEKMKRAINFAPPYAFHPARCVREQRVVFEWGGREMNVEAGPTTPLYDTIYETTDYDSYQLKEFTLNASGEGNVIVDIGANVGITALVLSQLPNARVTCFEPVSENVDWIRRNIKRNELENVRVESSAVTATDGEVWFQMNELSVDGLVTGAEVGPSERRMRVAAVSLEGALRLLPPGPVALAKVDCEGGEYEIVDQITPEIAARVLRWSFEVHDKDAKRNIDVFSGNMGALGYRLKYKPDAFGRPGLHHLLATKG